MAIQAEIINNIFHFSVSGLMKSKEEKEKLFLLLENPPLGIQALHITFFDAKMIEADVVEKISQFIESNSNIKLKIFIIHRYLSSYLIKLGIINTFIPKKTLHEAEAYIIKAIAIGGSADSLEKIFNIIENLPDSNVSIFIVQHVREDSVNLLETLLKEKTDFNVHMAENKSIIEEKTIYIAPGGYQMKVSEKKIILTKEPPVNYARPSIEVLLHSLSEEYNEELLAIILCGYGNDGSNALQFLKKNHSKVIIENPAECTAKDLPQNCINTKNYDHVFSINEINNFILSNLKCHFIRNDELKEFLKELFDKYGYDFQDYQVESIKRRINLFMINEKMPSFQILKNEVLNKPEVFEDLLLGLSVNVTEFFRNPEVFKELKDKVIPYLNSFASIKIWCVGCSTGEEAYSLAILLNDSGILNKTLIYATDINPYVIEEAKSGLYSKKILPDLTSNYALSGGISKFEKYFEFKFQYIKIKDSLKKNILFFQHSLVGSGILNEFQLIICRNVLIYLDYKLQEKTLKLFNNSLDISGFLVLGDKEDIVINNGKKYFSAYDKKTKIYKKK